MSNKIIGWWSGGVTSAVACKIAIDLYGKENCQIIMIDTRNEDQDTYRFKDDCAKWYDLPIKVIDNFGGEYEKIEDVWHKHLSLNVASGAVCSSELKRKARQLWQKENEYKYQVFGFEQSKREFNRSLAMTLNHPDAKPIYPLLMMGMNKLDCMEYIQKEGIVIPRAYTEFSLHNNNCLKTLCIQGGIGYWKKAQIDHADKFDTMAEMEHDLTNLKGQPVTMLKDQSNSAKAAVKAGDKFVNLVFLKKHPDYPNNKCLDDMRGRPVEPLMECNGFCGTNELNPKSETELELNLESYE